MMSTSEKLSLPEAVVFASHNSGKVAEVRDLLKPYAVRVYSAEEMQLPDPPETGSSFLENALIKARAAAVRTDLPVLADDSGLCVEALAGAPGIYSARWAREGGRADFGAAMAKVERELGAAPTTTVAYFVCAVVWLQPDGSSLSFCGRVQGNVAFPPLGNNGFGYDPIFRPVNQQLTLAEMSLAAKQGLSHRGRALRQLVMKLFK